jgi:hypothetical protein
MPAYFLKEIPRPSPPPCLQSYSIMNVNLKHYVKLTIKRRIVMQLEGRDKRQQNVGSS